VTAGRRWPLAVPSEPMFWYTFQCMLAMQPGADPVAQLAQCVDELAAEDLRSTPDAALGESLVELRRQVDRLEAEFGRRLRRFHRTRGFVSDGAATLVSWLRSLCRLSPSAAHQRVELARGLEELPAVVVEPVVIGREGAFPYKKPPPRGRR